MLDATPTDLIVVSEPSGRQLIGPVPNVMINDEGVMVLCNPMMFAEQRSQDPQSGKIQIQSMMMPLLFSEFIDKVTLLPASWMILPANCAIAHQYRAQWDDYETNVRAQSAGIVTSRTMPKGPVLVPPNGRP
jgi:hypothetical protein